MKHILLILLLMSSRLVMAEGRFIHSYNEASERYAILDEQEASAVLYLTEAGSQKPLKDAFAYMRQPPIEMAIWKEKMLAGEPPVLHKELASEQAVILNSAESDFSFQWGIDGQAVALIFKGNPIALISLKEKYGFSKAVVKQSPVVNPWSQELYEQLFSK